MKFRTRLYLAKKYDCDPRTLNTYLRELGTTHIRKLMPKELEMIKDRIGFWEK